MRFQIKSKCGEIYLVREPTMDDLDQILAYITELVNEKALILMDHVPTRDEEREWLRDKIEDAKNGNVIYWIVEKAGKVVGSIESRRGSLKQKHMAELGIALLKEARGKGIAKALTSRLIKETLKKWLDVNLIWLGVYSKNEPAKHLYWKLGFRPVARLPLRADHFGELIDEEIWYWKDSPALKKSGLNL